MTTAQWIVLDHAIALLGVVSWFGAGVAAALRRHQLGFGLLIAAVLVTLTRAATVSILAGRGWWFVADKVLLGLPLLGVAGVAAVLTAGPRLWTAIKAAGERPPASCVVSLFTAAYAALAGLVVTFLGGYPLTWSTALTTVSLVSAGAVLTARVVAREADDEGARRDGSSSLSPAGGSSTPPSEPGSWVQGRRRRPAVQIHRLGGDRRRPRSLVQLPSGTVGGRSARAGSPSPGGARHRHVLTAKAATVRLGSGREIDAWTYNGHVPGPAITATEGDVIEVTLRNSDIEDGVTQHWHGYDVPCGEDGVPDLTQRPVAPGEEFVYRFRADQVGTYWYHTHEASDPGVRKGLYGTLVVTPRAGQRTDARSGRQQVDLTLPVHTFAGIVVVGDQDGRTEQTAAPGTAVRLRLINTDSDPHRLTLAGTPFRVAAVDGRDLNHPEQVRDVSLRLPAGGRYDLVFVMPDTAVALVLDNHRDTGVTLHPDDDAEREPRIEDTSDWPELDLLRYGTPARAPFDPDAADRHFTLVLDRALAMVDGRPAYAQTVNGRGHPSVPDLLVAEGDVVRLTVVNRSLETHPWHLHGHSVLILSRDGTPSSGSPLWMDTFEVRAGEVWEVAFKATNPGIWMNHCHNLRHAEQGMMLRVAYDGVTTHFGYAHATHG
ncbi:multicopper oxidase domain-containing protein [Streptomyces chiangmaiensis]